ncbi:DinB family protein [Adhaeribacter sp. BT258]|uniref:DinB family protein n=1 Tax=Adhaeribacter terrigena TaxID=2793070 RepID=A0ABS1BWZ5_9BACT|nr:DinB family protein [Adhaeribacter terrigena]MBK0401659.1 DinB family protein [Adhaeribacter terrigena]
MHPQIETIRKTREALLNLIHDLTIEEINEIPAGFNNNIIWNVAHLIAAQQGVCYFRAGLPLKIENAFFLAYKPESKPEQRVTAEEVEKIKEMLFTTLDQLETDYGQNIFTNYTPWTTRYGVAIQNIDEAISFLPFHEGIHLGYVMALKKVIKNKVLV